MRGGILALDLSSCTGFCYGRPGEERPAFGVWLLPTERGWGRAFCAFENELEDAIALFGPERVIMEAPMPAAMAAAGEKRRNEAAAYQQFGLAALTEATCYRYDVPCDSASALTVRKAVLGTGRIPKGEVKRVIVGWCQRRGWDVPDHNAGDACVLWRYACVKAGSVGALVA